MNRNITIDPSTSRSLSRKALPLLLGAMFCTAGALQPATAETVEQTLSIHHGILPFTTSGYLAQFDGTLGTLLEVRYQVNALFQYQIEVSPGSALPQLVTIQASGSLADGTGSNLSSTPMGQAGADYFGGIYGSTINAGFGGPIVNTDTTDPGDLALYTDSTPPGLDLFTFNVHSNAFNITPPVGYSAALVANSADYDIKLTYTYAPVPEPSTAALSALAIGFVGCRRHRAKRA